MFAQFLLKLSFGESSHSTNSIICWRHFITKQHLLTTGETRPVDSNPVHPMPVPSHSSLQDRTKAASVCDILLHIFYITAVNTEGYASSLCLHYTQQNFLLWVTITRSKRKPAPVTEGCSSRFITLALEDSCHVYLGLGSYQRAE